MAKDPVCGMIVDEKTALSADIGGRHFYFLDDIKQKDFSVKRLRQMCGI